MGMDNNNASADVVAVKKSVSFAAFSEKAVEDVRPRSGTVFTGYCQIVTAVVGAGILALPNAMAALGWVAGLILLVVFAIVTYFCSLLLIDCCEHDGVRHPSYYHAVKAAFPNTRWPRVSMQIVQQSNLVLTGLGYAITAGKALQKVAVELAPEGTDPDAFYLQVYFWVFMFACLEVLICQIPTLEELNWVSVFGALMSFAYSIIAMYYGFSYWGTNPGTIGGEYTTAAAKTWSIFTVRTLEHFYMSYGATKQYSTQALGTIAFAYNFSTVAVEITDTIQEPFKAKMKHSLTAAVPSMCTLFLLVVVPNYEAMGNDIAGYVFDSYSSPVVPIVIANLCVVFHLAGAFAVFSAPVFYLVETSMTRATNMSNNAVVAFRVIWRVSYVAIIGLLGALMPFFNAFVGLVGGLSFWPLTVGLVRIVALPLPALYTPYTAQPISMWSAKHKPGFWTRIALQTVSAICLLISLLAVAGSVEDIVSGFDDYSIGF